MDDHSRPVTGYPAPGQLNPNGYSTNTATTGTAYPYAAPPPPPQPTYYNPNPYYQQQPYPTQRVTFMRRILAILIASVIITAAVIFIVWLVLRPHIPEFRVDSVTLSNFNLSSNSLITGNWDVHFAVRNPNKKITLSYDQIVAAVYYRSESLSETTITPFFQDTKNETTIRATFAAASAYVDTRVVDSINGDRSSRGSVSFAVRMLARVRFKAGAWRGRRRFLKVVCGDLSVGVSSNRAGGSLIGGPRQCRVGL